MKKKLSMLLCVCIICLSISAIFPLNAYAKIMYGDPNGDGSVTMSDVIIMQKHVAKLTELKYTAFKSADVTEPYNQINMVDITEVQKYIAKLITSFPVEINGNDSDTDTLLSDNDSMTDTEFLSDTEDDENVSDTQSDTGLIIDGVLTLSEAREYGAGIFLTLRGQVVYVCGGNTVILEEENDGVVTSYQIFDKNGVQDGKYPLNSIVEVTGTTSYYINTLQISNPENVEIVSRNNTPISPVETEIDKLQDYISTKVIIRGVTVLSNKNGILEVGKGSNSVKSYRPAPFPDGIDVGSFIDLICVPYIYDGNVQIRISYTTDYALSQIIPDSETDSTVSDTDNSDSDIQSDSDDDSNTDSDTEFNYDGLYHIFNANDENITSLTACGYLILSNDCYAVSGKASDGSLLGLEFIFDSNDGYAMAESKSAYIAESDGNGNYYLKNMYLDKYISASADNTSTVFTDEPTGAVKLSATSNGNLLITDINTGRYLGIKDTKGQTVFRWYKSKSSACEITIYIQEQ